MSNTPQQEWWRDAPQLDALRGASVAQGLRSDQAQQRLAEVGPNRFGQAPALPGWRQYLRHFRNPLVLTLLLASGVSAATGEVTNFLIIACIVLLSVTLDFWQELRAGQVVERLRQSVAVRATVLRDGQWQEHPVADLVPGDVVRLAAGDLVPADALVLQARDFFVNQSVLTGESYPVEKHAHMPEDMADMEDATHAVFMGSSVVSGMAQVVLVRTGAGTAMGEVASSLTQEPEPTSFELGMRRFGMLILRLTFLLVLFVLLINGLMGRPLLESFLFAVALAVGLTPELLPMVVSVTLSRGAMRMAQQGIVVKRPSAIQDLGSMDVLCTDKTGTLTEAHIRMERHVDPLGRVSERSLELAWLNSHFESGLRSPLDEAILQHRTFDASVWTKIDEVPFDFERRRVSVLLERSGERELVVKGAPDDILKLCTAYEAGDAQQPLDDAALAQVQAQATQMPWPTEVLVGVNNMAQLMAESDLAIGAAGSTSWERCCLGVPTLMLVLAANQIEAARAIEGTNAAWTLSMGDDLTGNMKQSLSKLSDGSVLMSISAAASGVCDGRGSDRIANLLVKYKS